MLLASSGVALATTKWDIILVPIGFHNPIPDGTETVAHLAVTGGCLFTTPGFLDENKKEFDFYQMEPLDEARACESATTTEMIEKVTWETKFAPERILVTFKGNGIKYRTSSPKCTYSTPVYQDSFSPTKSKWYVEATTVELIGSESELGCAAKPEIDGEARLYDPAKGVYVNAEFRCEYFEEVC